MRWIYSIITVFVVLALLSFLEWLNDEHPEVLGCGAFAFLVFILVLFFRFFIFR